MRALKHKAIQWFLIVSGAFAMLWAAGAPGLRRM